MFNTIKYTIIDLVRIPGIMIWALVFPLVLMSVFAMMFGPLDDMEDMEPIRVVVVDSAKDVANSAVNSKPNIEAFNASLSDENSFRKFIDAISTGDDRLLDVTFTASPEKAEEIIEDSFSTDYDYAGYVQLIGEKPQVNIAEASSASGMEGVEASILIMLMDEYTSKSELLKRMLMDSPEAFANSAVMESIFNQAKATTQIDVTRNQPRESVRYYFALLGMAALFGANLSLIAFQRMKPNVSALGARRMIGSLSHSKEVIATLIACWIVSFVCLIIAYVYMRFVIGIDFADRDLECILVVAAASMTAMALGCAISAIPKVPEDGKTGLLTGIVCFAALFAGLYGQPTMELADLIADNFPAATWINPASQIAQAFYSIMYYDTMIPALTHIAALVAISVVLFFLSVGSMRRQRYASI